MAEWLTGLEHVPFFFLLFLCCLFSSFVTELFSNTSTANVLLPVAASLSKSLKLNPFFLMVPMTGFSFFFTFFFEIIFNPLFYLVSFSCAFTLPASTPPNSMLLFLNLTFLKYSLFFYWCKKIIIWSVFSTRKLKVTDMLKIGVILNLIALFCICFWSILMAPLIFSDESHDSRTHQQKEIFHFLFRFFKWDLNVNNRKMSEIWKRNYGEIKLSFFSLFFFFEVCRKKKVERWQLFSL